MVYKFLSSVLWLFVVANVSRAQPDYLIGSSAESIEPDSSVFSLTLGGYAAPREGRFTISWKEVGKAEGVRSLTGLNDKLYAVDTFGELLEGSLTAAGITWKKIGQAENITEVTGLDGKLYAINSGNDLLLYDVLRPAPAWKNIGKAGGVSRIAAFQGKLYASNNSQLLTRDIRNRKASWTKLSDADSVTSITAYRNKIYTLRTDHSIWAMKLYPRQEGPVKIARYNGSTYSIRLKQLVVLKDRLYGIADDGRVYLSVHSTEANLFAKTLAVRRENKTVVIVGVDLVGIDYSLVSEIKHIIFNSRNIPPDAILVNISHTHFAPVTQAWPTWAAFSHYPDSSYLRNIVRDRIVKAIESAVDNMSPSNIYFAKGTTQIGYNRSSGTGEPYDNSVDVLKVTGDNNEVNSLVFLTGCHPVFRNEGKEAYTISANYPGVTKEILEKSAGVRNAIFLQGCAGDINPKDNDHEKTGMRLAIDVMSVLQTEMKKITGVISYALDTIAIPVIPWSQEKILQFKKENLNKEGNVSAEKNVRWADLMMEKYKNGTVPSLMPVYVQTINIGTWKLVGLSREVVTEYGMAIKALWPGNMVSVAGYTNDVSSYLPTKRHIEKRTYEGDESFFWYAQPAVFPPDVFETIVEKIKLLNR